MREEQDEDMREGGERESMGAEVSMTRGNGRLRQGQAVALGQRMQHRPKGGVLVSTSRH